MGVENIKIVEDRVTEVIGRALQAREKREGLFAHDHIFKMPEEELAEAFKVYGREINDKAFPANALFLTVPFIMGTHTRPLLKRLSSPDNLKQYGWLYQPERVIAATKQEADDELVIDDTYVKRELKKLFRPTTFNYKVMDEWVHNCEALLNIYQGDVRIFFDKFGGDAIQVVQALKVRDRCKTNQKPEWHRYGPKLSRYAVQVLHQYGFYIFINANKISFPIDSGIGGIFITTGGIKLVDSENVYQVNKAISPIVTDICAANGWQPREVSETLWAIGSDGCAKNRHDLCPLETICTPYETRPKYFKKGKFNPAEKKPVVTGEVVTVFQQ